MKNKELDDNLEEQDIEEEDNECGDCFSEPDFKEEDKNGSTLKASLGDFLKMKEK